MMNIDDDGVSSHKMVMKLLTEVEGYIVSDPHQLLGGVLEVLKNHNLCKNVAEKIHLELAYGNKGIVKLLAHSS